MAGNGIAKQISKFVIAIAVSGLAGVIGSIFTVPAVSSGWYDGLVKPALNPPSWVFGPVWTALYFLIGIAVSFAMYLNYLLWTLN